MLSGLVSTVWRFIGRRDNVIDKDVDRVIYRMETESFEAFKKRWSSKPMSDKSRAALRIAVAEQLKSESSPERLAKLNKLDQRLTQLSNAAH